MLINAYVLKYKSDEIFKFTEDALTETLRKDITAGELITLVLKAGEVAVKTMELLDKANTTRYGKPEITHVSTSLIKGPGILVSVMIFRLRRALDPNRRQRGKYLYPW